jgi:hypothetical protein
MNNITKELTVRELIAILETHNPDAIINVRDSSDRWSEITVDNITRSTSSRADYVYLGHNL